MSRVSDLFIYAVVLSIIFTVALLYATFYVTRIVDNILLNIIQDYQFVPGEQKPMELYRLVGYSSFTVILVLMLLGFLIKKRYLVTSSAAALFLPTFSYFASYMFFLAGMGFLRIFWIPLMDVSPEVLRLGEIVYAPFVIVMYPLTYLVLLASGFFWNLSLLFSLAIMGAGLFFLLLGTITWLYGRIKGLEIVDFWIYKYSRHPQYLGFILWSYSVLLYATLIPWVQGGYFPASSLPWLIFVLTIIGIALHEENMMIKKYGEKYATYRQSTPFFFPFPKPFSDLIKAPVKILLKKDFLENWKEIVCIIIIYGVVLILLSALLSRYIILSEYLRSTRHFPLPGFY